MGPRLRRLGTLEAAQEPAVHRFTTVAEYVAAAPAFKPELRRLRALLRKTELEETVKWGGPCYVLGGTNVVGLGAFKSYLGLWFHQGALLSDPAKVLVAASRKTKALRQWRFTSGDAIDEDLVRRYVDEAIAHARDGRSVPPRRPRPVVVPPELKAALAADPAAEVAFAAMSPSCRREYAEHVAEAKRDETKQRRVAKILPMIKAGGGLHDRYRRG